MKSKKQVARLVRVLGALVAGIRDECGHDVAVRLWANAIKKGIRSCETDSM